jgi:hypothetical protein
MMKKVLRRIQVNKKKLWYQRTMAKISHDQSEEVAKCAPVLAVFDPDGLKVTQNKVDNRTFDQIPPSGKTREGLVGWVGLGLPLKPKLATWQNKDNNANGPPPGHHLAQEMCFIFERLI